MSRLAKKTIAKLKSKGVRLRGGYVTVPLTKLGKKRFASKKR